MIAETKLPCIDIYDCEQRFSELANMQQARGGLWNVNWIGCEANGQRVFDLRCPTIQDDCNVWHGESRYAYHWSSPEDQFNWHLQGLTADPAAIVANATPKVYRDKWGIDHDYLEVELMVMLGWLMLKGELKIQDAIYYMKW